MMNRYQSTPQPFNRLEPVDGTPTGESQKSGKNNLSSEAIQRMMDAAKSIGKSSSALATPELKKPKKGSTTLASLTTSP